jgi:hypothetical protein
MAQSQQEVRRNLRGAEFPASKQDLRRQAEQNNANDEFLAIIDELPDGQFDTIEDVVAEIEEATEPAGGQAS